MEMFEISYGQKQHAMIEIDIVHLYLKVLANFFFF